MKVLLQYNSSSKVREITEPTEIFAVIEEAYVIQKETFFLQKYDEEFEEYVDLEDVSSIENKSKIKIINTAVASEVFINHEHIKENIAGQSVCNYHVENDPHVEVILNLKEQWPSVINLPFTDFSHPLTDALEKGLDLNWSCSSELVSHLAMYAYRFKCYPTKEERLQICEALICKYPYLKNEIGSGTGGWEAKLLNKLKKIRLNDTSLEIRLNRTKRKSLSSPAPKRLKLNPEKGEINWSPDHIEGETEISQNVHKDIMKEESKKALQVQNKSKLKSLMELTYSFRRYQINNNISIAELIKEYPIFFQEEEQFEEFHRLTSVNLKETFFKEALSKSPKLFQVFRKNKSDHLKEIKKDIETTFNILDGSTTYDQETRFGLLVLPYLLKEQIEYFVEMVPCDVFESVCPKIFYVESFTSNHFFIVAENQCLAETKDFLNAVALLISFYYTLNISYPKQIMCTLKFLQKYFVKINGGSFPQKVIRLYKKVLSEE